MSHRADAARPLLAVKFRRKRSVKGTQPVRTTSRLWTAVVRGALILAGVCIATTVAIIAYQEITSNGLYRTDYEGKIIDKSLTVRETRYGAGASRRLVIQSKSGERFEVVPSETVYERAQKGMWIRSGRKSGVELSWSETEWTPAMESR